CVQAEDGIRDATVTGVQTCALPISLSFPCRARYIVPLQGKERAGLPGKSERDAPQSHPRCGKRTNCAKRQTRPDSPTDVRTTKQIGRASCRERVESWEGEGTRQRKE